MSFLSRIFRPQVQVQKKVVMLRSFEAARYDKQHFSWFGDYGISAADTATQLPVVRARTREAAKNDAYVQHALQMFVNNIVGHRGIGLRCNYDNGDREASLKIQDAVEKAWKLWCETPEYCDAGGTKTMRRILAQAVRNWKREGEAILRIIPDAPNPFGISLMPVRPDALAVSLIDEDKRIYNGVEVDDQGRPVAYHFYKAMSASGVFYGETEAVPAEYILHLFDEDYVGQRRGFPVFAGVLRTLKDLHEYTFAELTAARADAMKCGVFKREGGDPAAVGDKDEAGNMFQERDVGEALVLDEGWSYENPNPSRPNAGAGPFTKMLLREAASGLSLPYNTWANDLEGVSYSSIRAGTLEDRDTWMMLQEDVVEMVLRPLFRRDCGWLSCAVAGGKLDIDVLILDDVRVSDTWRPRRWKWVDPASDANAAAIAVEHGWTTDSDIAAEQGSDFWDNAKTKAEEDAWKKAQGVTDEGKDEADEDWEPMTEEEGRKELEEWDDEKDGGDE